MDGIHGYEIKETEIDGVKVLHQNLHVGHAYSVPSVFDGWRRSNNEAQALEHAKEDIASQGKHHEWRHSEANPSGAEYIFSLKQKIADLESKLGVKSEGVAVETQSITAADVGELKP